MTRSPHRRFPLPRSRAGRLTALALLACAACACAQQQLPRAPGAQIQSSAANPTSLEREAGLGAQLDAGSSPFVPPAGSQSGQDAGRPVWNQSLYDAFQPGAATVRLTVAGQHRIALESASPFIRARSSSLRRAAGERPAAPDMMFLSLDSEPRAGNELRFNSSAGTLRFNQGMGGRGYYPLARMGPGAPLASFTTPNLGSSLVNFSASAFAGGSGYGTPKRAGPSISLRLNF